MTAILPLKPSLEGWKRGIYFGLVRIIGTLKPSLEGWKLCEGCKAAPKILHLETFLRGMETESTDKTCFRQFSLKPSLEGWKLMTAILPIA